MRRDAKWLRFLLAYSTSIAGDRFADLTIPIVSLALTGNLQLAGVYIAASSVPRFILGPALSPTVKRRPDRSWCSIGNWIQSLALAALAVAVFLEIRSAAMFAIVGVIAGIGSGIFGLASQATVRELVPNDRMAKSNAHLEISDSALTLVIPLVAGFVVQFAGPSVAIAASAFMFAIAAMLRLGLWAGSPRIDSSDERRMAKPRIMLALMASLKSPMSNNHRRFVSFSALALVAGGALVVPVAAFQIESLGGNAIVLGLAVSAAGAGGLIASWCAGHFGTASSSTKTATLLLVLFLLSVPVILISPSLWFIVLIVGLNDALASWLYVSLPTIRLLRENSQSLIPITAGMMTLSAVTTFTIGILVALFSSGLQLAGLVVCTVILSGILVVASFSRFKRSREFSQS